MEVIDILRDQSNHTVTAITRDGITSCFNGYPTSDILLNARTIICFNSRELIDRSREIVNSFNLSDRTYDLKLIDDHKSLQSLVRQYDPLNMEELVDAELFLTAHIEAATTAGINLNHTSLIKMVPQSQLMRFFSARAKSMFSVFDRLTNDMRISCLRAFEDMISLREIERSGARVEPVIAAELITKGNLSTNEIHVCRSIVSQHRDNIVYTRYSPVGAKTGRFRVTGGFGTMSIPKGRIRRLFTSRFKNGKIASIDFNAIDYRCIVSSIPELTKFYESCDDFHTRTAELLGDNVPPRDILKHLTYSYMYGASEETCAKQCSLPIEEVRQLLSRLDMFMGPIKKFKEDLHRRSISAGSLTVPLFNSKVIVESTDHAGKVLGLYAQTYSSRVFGRFLNMVTESNDRPKNLVISFPVHDELVVDIPQEEEHLLDTFFKSKTPEGHVIRIKKGSSYGDLS